MENNVFQSILVALMSTSAMFGFFHVVDNQFEIRTQHKGPYAILFGGCMFGLNLIHSFTSMDNESMISKRILSTIIGLSIIGLFMRYQHMYETSRTWSAIVSSLIFVYLVIFGIGPPVDINPFLFESYSNTRLKK